MSAERKAIRNAIRDVVIACGAVGARVSTSRVVPIWESELPCAVVYAGADRAERFNESTNEYQRTAAMTVEIYAEATADLDDALDDLGETIEAAIMADETLGGIAADLRLTNSEPSLTGDGDTVHGVLTLSFDVEYFRTFAPAVDDSEAIEGVDADIENASDAPAAGDPSPDIAATVDLP